MFRIKEDYTIDKFDQNFEAFLISKGYNDLQVNLKDKEKKIFQKSKSIISRDLSFEQDSSSYCSVCKMKNCPYKHYYNKKNFDSE